MGLVHTWLQEFHNNGNGVIIEGFGYMISLHGDAGSWLAITPEIRGYIEADTLIERPSKKSRVIAELDTLVQESKHFGRFDYKTILGGLNFDIDRRRVCTCTCTDEEYGSPRIDMLEDPLQTDLDHPHLIVNVVDQHYHSNHLVAAPLE